MTTGCTGQDLKGTGCDITEVLSWCLTGDFANPKKPCQEDEVLAKVLKLKTSNKSLFDNHTVQHPH
jgi:hypothetical protein